MLASLDVVRVQEATEDQETRATMTTSGHNFEDLVMLMDAEAVDRVVVETEAGAAVKVAMMTRTVTGRVKVEKGDGDVAGGDPGRGATRTTTERLASSHCPSSR